MALRYREERAARRAEGPLGHAAYTLPLSPCQQLFLRKVFHLLKKSTLAWFGTNVT